MQNNLELHLILRKHLVETASVKPTTGEILFESSRLWHKETLTQTLLEYFKSDLGENTHVIKVVMPGLEKVLRYRMSTSVVQLLSPAAKLWAQQQFSKYEIGHPEMLLSFNEFEKLKEIHSVEEENNLRVKKTIVLAVKGEIPAKTLKQIEKSAQENNYIIRLGIADSLEQAPRIWKDALISAGLAGLFEDWKTQVVEAVTVLEETRKLKTWVHAGDEWVDIKTSAVTANYLAAEDIYLAERHSPEKQPLVFLGEEKWIYVDASKIEKLEIGKGLQIENHISRKNLSTQPTSPLMLNDFGDIYFGEDAGWDPGPMLSGRGSQPMFKDFWDLTFSEDLITTNKGQKVFQTMQAMTKKSEFPLKSLDDVKYLTYLTLRKLNLEISKLSECSDTLYAGPFSVLWPDAVLAEPTPFEAAEETPPSLKEIR